MNLLYALLWIRGPECWREFWQNVAIVALLQREHWRWLHYGGLAGPGEGQITPLGELSDYVRERQ